MGVYQSAIAQSFRIPKPPITENNTPDQTGRVHIVTGGYGGVGLELAEMLYAANAHVYIAGRTHSKYESAEKRIKANVPNSKGSLSFLLMDFANLATIAPAVKDFQSKSDRLDVLTLNAGVMMPPKGMKDTHGEEIQLGTNCLGSYLAYELLRPTLVSTADTHKESSVRVSWAGSLAVDLLSPKPNGVVFTNEKDIPSAGNAPKVYSSNTVNYGTSKAGNMYFAGLFSERDRASGVIHTCFNPGNLKTDLQRHVSSIESLAIGWMLYPANHGGYTELWCAVSPDVTVEKSGSFVAPWGRFFPYRDDIKTGIQGEKGKQWLKWAEEKTAKYKSMEA